MEGVATVVLGLEEPEVAEEVMHFLDRSGGARVVATANDRRQLDEAVRQLEPDAIVASPAIATGAALGTSVLLAVDTAESVRSLRTAIAAGARGFFLWPGDRDALAGAASRLAGDAERTPARGGSVWTVFGPRGGTGTTFVACHLAATLAAGPGTSVVLADLDLAFADCTHALGVEDPAARTLADLAPVLAELRPRHVEEVLRGHAAGFRVLLAPAASPEAGRPGAPSLDARAVPSLLEALRAVADRVVTHVPRGFEPATRRGEVGLADIERVLGCPAVVIPADTAAPAAQDRGELVPLRGRTGRAFRDLVAAMEARG